MAIFFIASGYCYKKENADSFSSVCSFIKRKILTLWLPYVLWNGIYSCMHNFFIRANIYTDNPLILEYMSDSNADVTEYWNLLDIIKNILKSFLLHGRTEMGGAFWFIITLMELSVLYCIIDFAIKSLFKRADTCKAQIYISIVFLLMGYGCYIFGYSFWGMDRVLSYYILFQGGYALKRYGLLSKNRTRNNHIFIFGVSLLILIVCNQLGSISLNINRYGNPAYFLIVSFVGWQFLYEIAYFIEKTNKFEKCLICVGQNTIAIVILHFLCFKIVNYIGVLIKEEPLCLVAAFPIRFYGGLWWMAYMAIGLVIPVVLSLGYKRWKKFVLNRRRDKKKMI